MYQHLRPGVAATGFAECKDSAPIVPRRVGLADLRRLHKHVGMGTLKLPETQPLVKGQRSIQRKRAESDRDPQGLPLGDDLTQEG